MTRWPAAEVEVAAPVVAWLRAAGWDVYQEVRQRGASGRACDIIATRDFLVWAVEAKVHLNNDVVEQVHWWRQFAHYASVAVPSRVARPGPGVLRLALRTWGIGVFGVKNPDELYFCDVPSDAERAVRAVVHEDQPKLNRHADTVRLRASLCEEHKSYLAAGSACGGGWSPYKATCVALAALVAQHPGVTLSVAIKGKPPSVGLHDGIVSDGCIAGIKHHYRTDATAIASLRMWIAEGKVPGVRADRDGKVIRLYPV